MACLPFGPLRALSRVWTNCWFCFSDYGEAVVRGATRVLLLLLLSVVSHKR